MSIKSKQRRDARRRRSGQSKPAGVASLAPARVPLTFQQIRRKLHQHSHETQDWAGVPMPVQEAALVMAPGHPRYENLHGVQLGEPRRSEKDADATFVNAWYERKWRRTICVWRNARGRTTWGQSGAGSHGERMGAFLKMIGISMTMDVEAERRAMATLRQLIKPHLADAYEMLGWFIETSARSGVTYLFRRLAPTIAFKLYERDGQNCVRFLAALCLHPIAFYESLPIGAMVPTDDVVAHLVMMRADEVMFWRKSNQHGPFSPGAQI